MNAPRLGLDPWADEEASPPQPRDLDGAGVVTLSDVAPERVEWLWPRRLPLGKLVLIDGDPAVGKSTLGIDLAARVTTGARWPDGAPGSRPGDVLLMSAEDGLADTIAPRVLAADGDPSRVHALTGIDLGGGGDEPPRCVPPCLPRDIDRLEKVITSYGVRFLIVDVLMAYLAGTVDSHRDQDVRTVLHRLSALAENTGCCTMLIRHLNKSTAGSPLYRGGGSIGIIGAARAAYIAARDPDDETRRILAVTKLNIAAEPPSLAYKLVEDPRYGCARVEWESAPTRHTAAALLAAPADPDERTERADAGDWLVAYLERVGGSARYPDVARAARADDFGERTLKRARADRGVTSTRQGFGGGAIWSLDTPPIQATIQSNGASPQELARMAPMVAPMDR